MAPSGAGGTLRAGHLPVFPVDGERPGGAAAGPGLRRGAGEQRADLEMMHQFTGEARRGSLAGFGACSPEGKHSAAVQPVAFADTE